jgi:hypothetical protein
LERFFTVWAWNWDVGQAVDFADHVGTFRRFGHYVNVMLIKLIVSGTPLHPRYQELTRALDSLSEKLPSHHAPCVLVPPYIIPSTRYTEYLCPPALPRHLLSYFAGSAHPSQQEGDDDNISHVGTGSASLASASAPSGTSKSAAIGGLSTMSMPNMGITMEAMDIRKWNWPGYLTFGKGPSGKASGDAAHKDKDAGTQSEYVARELLHVQQAEVDQVSLQDAVDSDQRCKLEVDVTPTSKRSVKLGDSIVPTSQPVDSSGLYEGDLAKGH